MPLKIDVIPHVLKFSFQAGTSRGIVEQKKIWYFKVFDSLNPGVFGLGEAGPLSGLSIDDVPDFENKLMDEIQSIKNEVLPSSVYEVFALSNKISIKFPSIQFGVETALLDLFYGGRHKLFDCPFYDNGMPIQINGLVWMGDQQVMLERLNEKIEQGFRCIKIKIGAIDLDKELDLLYEARKKFDPSQLELRVDANGAFGFERAKEVMKQLAELKVHSIEQPIAAGEVLKMRDLCAKSPVPIALDEELIGFNTFAKKYWLIKVIQPQYIILKPSLLGGFASTKEWIEIAEEFGVGWWVTSALESNIGLNAICQFTSSLNVSLPQGLGTGSLYKNNIESPLKVVEDKIFYDATQSWGQVIK